MDQQRPVSIVHDAGPRARDRYRWLLLTGWFVLISTVFPFVIAMRHLVQPASGIPIALAAVAFVLYNIAIRRYWTIALGLLIVFIAVIGWIVAQ